ncbi:hypothetical protein JOM56_011798, partial [Amanita muscaria]
MRLSTVFVSSAFVLAGMSAAFSKERENMLVARFADFDFFGEVEARAYDEEPELCAQGGAINHKPFLYASHHDPPHYETIRRRNLPWEEEYPQTVTNSPIRVVNLPFKPRPSRRRRSFYEPSRIEITRRRDVPMHP